MTPGSRPVRAVVAVLSGWSAARVALLWPFPDAVAYADRAFSLDLPSVAQPLVPNDIWTPPAAARTVEVGLDAPTVGPVHSRAAIGVTTARSTQTGKSLEISLDESVDRLPSSQVMPGVPPAATPDVQPPSTKRFSGSAWALSRTGGSTALANGGQLGGSQAGVRIFYAVGPKALALTARFTAPLSSAGGQEAALGVALRGRNIGLIVEQRFALEKKLRSRPAITAYGGVSEVTVRPGVRFDGYAQVGVVGITHPQGFIDAAARLETTVIEQGRSRLSVGVAASGGAQPGVSRVDVGPQIVGRLSVGETVLRISGEWRQRIAGNATPGSGPVVTVGFDF